MKLVPIIVVEFTLIVCNPRSICFTEGFPLKPTMSMVYCLNTEHLHYFQGTKCAVKIKELSRSF